MKDKQKLLKTKWNWAEYFSRYRFKVHSVLTTTRFSTVSPMIEEKLLSKVHKIIGRVLFARFKKPITRNSSHYARKAEEWPGKSLHGNSTLSLNTPWQTDRRSSTTLYVRICPAWTRRPCNAPLWSGVRRGRQPLGVRTVEEWRGLAWKHRLFQSRQKLGFQNCHPVEWELLQLLGPCTSILKRLRKIQLVKFI